MRVLLFLSLLTATFLVQANEHEDCDNEPGKKLMKAVKAQEQAECPNPKKIRTLCMYVADLAEDTYEGEGRKFKYGYTRKIMEAACVDIEKDSKEVRAQKISQMWKQLESKLICNSVQFDIPNGNIIKYAAIRGIDPFIWDIIDWKVNLNKVDETDGRTVLDYIQYHIDRLKEGAIVNQLKIYYKELRKAGAKHKSEL